MTPRLHTSTSGPSYFFPWKSSGAAYGGEPQKVSSLLPMVNSLLKPKSAILIFMSASNSRFSAWRDREQRNPTLTDGTWLWFSTRGEGPTFRSRWTILLWWQYCTADTIWKKKQKNVSNTELLVKKEKQKCKSGDKTQPKQMFWMIIFHLISEYFYLIDICFAW